MYVVKATPSAGSSGDTQALTIGTAGTFEGAKWLGLKDFVDTWVQGNWTDYDEVDVFKFRKALVEKRVNDAWTLQAHMSGYLLQIDEAEEEPDPEPFDIECDFTQNIGIHEIYARINELGLLDVLTDLSDDHVGASTKSTNRHVDVWVYGALGYTYEFRDARLTDVLASGITESIDDIIKLSVLFLRTGKIE